MELITVASSGNVMVTNAAVSPEGRVFGNFGPDGFYYFPDSQAYFPNSQAPRVNRPYEVFKIRLA